MACPDKICDLTAVTADLDGFTFTEYVRTGDLIEFGDTTFESTQQRSNTGNKVRFSGETTPTLEVTINAFPCDPTWESLYQEHIRNTLKCFTALVVNDPCCNIRRLVDVRIISMSPPNVSSGDVVAPIVLEGTPIQ